MVVGLDPTHLRQSREELGVPIASEEEDKLVSDVGRKRAEIHSRLEVRPSNEHGEPIKPLRTLVPLKQNPD